MTIYNLQDHLHPFVDFMYPNNNGIFLYVMCHITGPKLFVIGLRNFLKNSNEWFCQLPWGHAWIPSNTCRTCMHKILHWQYFNNYVQLYKLHTWIFFKGISDDSSSRCHVKLFHIAKQKEIPHNIRKYLMTLTLRCISFPCAWILISDFKTKWYIC